MIQVKVDGSYDNGSDLYEGIVVIQITTILVQETLSLIFDGNQQISVAYEIIEELAKGFLGEVKSSTDVEYDKASVEPITKALPCRGLYMNSNNSTPTDVDIIVRFQGDEHGSILSLESADQCMITVNYSDVTALIQKFRE